MAGHRYTYRWFRYGAIEIMKATEEGPVSIAFLQGDEAVELYDELERSCVRIQQSIMSDYDYEEEAV
jgi:hypothetical protein